jgi:hypothetical protein
MRGTILCAALVALAACAAQPPSLALAPADASTALIAGGPLRMSVAAPRAGGDGQDPVVAMTLTHADGRSMQFQEANHTPHDVMAQAAGGPLAQVMGFFGDERPTLYARTDSGAPFLCAPEGPAMLGMFTAANGEVTIVGLKSAFEFEERDNGATEAVPYSPDHVCARLKFTRP